MCGTGLPEEEEWGRQPLRRGLLTGPVPGPRAMSGGWSLCASEFGAVEGGSPRRHPAGTEPENTASPLLCKVKIIPHFER